MGALRSTQRNLWRLTADDANWRHARRPWLRGFVPKPRPDPVLRTARAETMARQSTLAQRFAGFLAGLFKPIGRTT